MKTMNQECQAASPWHYNERKCEQSEDPTNNNSEVAFIVSISSSSSDVEEEESLEDVFQTITPINPTQTQPTSPSPPRSSSQGHHQLFNCPKLLYSETIDSSCKSKKDCFTDRPCTSFTDTENKSEINPFMPGGPKINLLFFDFLQLIAKEIRRFTR